MYQFFQDERGTAAIEYSLLISLIGLVMAGALFVLGANLVDAFSSVSGAFTSGQVIEDPLN
jgi:Flp pilus assembly pilin Flp